MAVKLGLHDNRPYVNANIKDHHGVKANLGPTTLAKVLHVEDITETKAADTGIKRDQPM
jgi:hypothetical protein